MRRRPDETHASIGHLDGARAKQRHYWAASIVGLIHLSCIIIVCARRKQDAVNKNSACENNNNNHLLTAAASTTPIGESTRG